jgi:hypothetical protein
LSTPFDENALRQAIAAGDPDAFGTVETELMRGRADARAWAATVLAEAPEGMLIERLLPLLQAGPHPSAAAYCVVCSVEMFAHERTRSAAVLWQEVERRGVPRDREGVGILHYAIRLGSLLGIVPEGVCSIALMADDDLCAIDAAELVLRDDGPTAGWGARLARVSRKYGDIAAVLRMDLGEPVADAVVEVAIAGGHWSFAACEALERAGAEQIAERLGEGSRKRFFVRPHHPRVAAAAWALGNLGAKEILAGYLDSGNQQVRGVARGEWLRLCGSEEQPLALPAEPAGSDAWLVDELLNRATSDVSGEALFGWLSRTASIHPDERVRDGARAVMNRSGR